MDGISLLDQMSNDLVIPKSRLDRVIANAPHRYKVYDIPKRSGKGRRTIAQPAKEVKLLQRWVMRNILCKFDIHSSAKAYIKGKGIFCNALPHVASKYLIKLDFKDFFYSIKARDFVKHLSICNCFDCSEIDVQRLQMILFYDKGGGDYCLSIGAPSSPLLSNIIMYGFDKSVSDYCCDNNIVYTRYSDDISLSMSDFSLREKAFDKVRQVLSELTYPKLILNDSKTIFSSKANKRMVTGLVIANEGKVSIGRDKKRLIRSQLYRLSKGLLVDEEIDRLQGMIAYVNSVEPEFIKRMSARYGNIF